MGKPKQISKKHKAADIHSSELDFILNTPHNNSDDDEYLYENMENPSKREVDFNFDLLSSELDYILDTTSYIKDTNPSNNKQLVVSKRIKDFMYKKSHDGVLTIIKTKTPPTPFKKKKKKMNNIL